VAPDVIHWLVVHKNGDDLQIAVCANVARAPILPTAFSTIGVVCKSGGDGCLCALRFDRSGR
jgi:hypothetical protein